MSPIEFPEANRGLTAPVGRPDVQPLPVYTDGARCVSCWSLTWRERFALLFHGRVWLSVLSGATQPPVALVPERDFFVK